MSYLVTGAAGFIGYHVALTLLRRGERVVGLDNLNEFYSIGLKRDRLAQLMKHPGFTFHRVDLADLSAVNAALKAECIRKVVHLAAQAGVRYSIENPHAYVQSNLAAHVNVLEYCRHSDSVEFMAYASSSSVYGGNTKMPFSESDRVDSPVSLYAATKKADELISHVYSHLFEMRQVGFRFFTVYGPWGRPDMAMWLFTRAILAGEPINVFNHGRMKRDFTYIDDIVSGVLAVLDSPEKGEQGSLRHRVYNIGHNHPEDLLHMIGVLEEALGRTAEKRMLPLQPGDVPESFADISALQRDYGFRPTTPISKGIPAFVDWYTDYHSRQ